MKILKKIARLFIMLIILITMSACKNIKISLLTRKMIGREVVIPKNLDLLNPQYIYDSLWLDTNNKTKLIIYIEKKYCTGCRITSYNLLDSILNIIPSEQFAPMVILEESNKEALRSIESAISEKQPSYPIYRDTKQELKVINPFIPSGDPIFNTFLLNTNNQIVLVGDPSFDYNIMKLYQKVLSNISTRNI